MSQKRMEMRAMKMHTALATVAAALALTLMAGAVHAQDVSGKGGPVQVGGDNWHADQTVHTEYWDGRVEVQQDDARLRADHIKLIHTTGPNGDSKSWGDVVRMEASGNVYYQTEDRTMTGDNAVYTKDDDTVVITGGKVVLQQGQNIMTGTRLVAHPNAGTSTFDSSPDSSNHGRVVAVLYPNEDNNGKPKKPAAPAKAAAASSSSAPH
jgi:lipopolysaccharide export system protein LptA